MQADGNAVSYDGKYVASWATGTNGNSGAYLKLQTDGNLVTSFIPFKAQNKINHESIKYGLLFYQSRIGKRQYVGRTRQVRNDRCRRRTVSGSVCRNLNSG